ncbi:hypothetical protein G6F22_020506 [Rhizopus arrhizus]|nr:hypothetical protein G6F22_020506 [Rhizopus arrhizus]
MRRFERQHLAVFSQRRFQFGQRRTRAHRHHQFGRVVADDAAIRRHVQQAVAVLRPYRTVIAVERLAASAHHKQRFMAGTGRHDLVAQFRQDKIHGGYVLEAGEIGEAQLARMDMHLADSAGTAGRMPA